MADNSLKTGRYLVDILNDQESLTVLLGGTNKIWPIVALEGTLYPLVIYTREAVNTTYTKIIGHDNTVMITFRVYSDKYDVSLDIANEIRNILERKSIKIEDEIQINDIRLSSTYEQFSEDGFLQSLTFTMTVE